MFCKGIALSKFSRIIRASHPRLSPTHRSSVSGKGDVPSRPLPCVASVMQRDRRGHGTLFRATEDRYLRRSNAKPSRLVC